MITGNEAKMKNERIKQIEANTLAKIAERSEAKKTNDAMGSLWNSKGRTIEIDGESLTITSVRACYGTAIELTLDRNLPGKNYSLLTIDAKDAADRIKTIS